MTSSSSGYLMRMLSDEATVTLGLHWRESSQFPVQSHGSWKPLEDCSQASSHGCLNRMLKCPYHMTAVFKTEVSLFNLILEMTSFHICCYLLEASHWSRIHWRREELSSTSWERESVKGLAHTFFKPPVSSTICWKQCPFSIKFPFHLCHKLTTQIYVGLFLDSHSVP